MIYTFFSFLFYSWQNIYVIISISAYHDVIIAFSQLLKSLLTTLTNTMTHFCIYNKCVVLKWLFSNYMKYHLGLVHVLTLKRLGGFLKNVSSKERVKPWFFMTFNNILRHIFPENFIEFPQVTQKIWRNPLSTLANFHQFSSVFWIFWHYLVTKKLMTSAYNRWCQHFLLSTYFK